MKLRWLGHSAFLITAADGTQIITDPYKSGSYGGAVRYRPIRERADIVTMSHEHDDHNFLGDITGNPVIVRDSGSRTVKGIPIKGIPSFHDMSQGRERGRNTIFLYEVDGLKICHLGDLGHVISPDQCREIGEVDIVLIPVGGFYTIDCVVAAATTSALNPKVVIPMHFKTGSLDFPIADVSEFVKGKKNVRQIGESEVEVKKEGLPGSLEIWVLKHAL